MFAAELEQGGSQCFSGNKSSTCVVVLDHRLASVLVDDGLVAE